MNRFGHEGWRYVGVVSRSDDPFPAIAFDRPVARAPDPPPQ